MGDPDWVTVSEAARRLGVSRTAIHNRIKRGTLSRMTDNHGNPLVQVSVTRAVPVTVATCRNGTPDTVTPPEPPQPRQDVSEMIPASVHLRTVEVIQEAHSAALAALEQRLSQQDANHLAEVERLVGQVHAERSFWIERADAAEVRAEAAEQRLAESRRPWWARWLGATTKSDLSR